jgi:excisionase family DNA binding protein
MEIETKNIPLLKVNEVSCYLQLSMSTVRRLVKQRKIPFLKIGKSIRFSIDDILDWLHNHEFYFY